MPMKLASNPGEGPTIPVHLEHPTDQSGALLVDRDAVTQDFPVWPDFWH